MIDWPQITSEEDLERHYMEKLPAIRLAARACGYAIGVHGSLRRDLDLIAVPWVDKASSPEELARAIAIAAVGMAREGLYQWEAKPHGRIATSIPIAWTWRTGVQSDGHIDLSVLAAPRGGEVKP